MKKTNEHKRISMFDTRNDTDNWIVAVDGLFGFVEGKAEATALLDTIGQIDDSVFGSCWIIPPQWTPKTRWDGSVPLQCISAYRAIDIRGYIAKHPNRQLKAYRRTNIERRLCTPANVRLAKAREQKRVAKMYFG